MCGIGGYYALSNGSFDSSQQPLERMQKAMEHRGPDGYRCFQSADKRLGLVHRRLSIMDLSQAGFQPFFDEEKKIAVCCNGEIYNYKELARELTQLGYQFSSNSDNEVLIYAYKAWGISFLHRLQGMFAFVLYDGNKQELYIARDQIGVKPIYFSLQSGMLSFASEIKALWAFPWISKSLNQQALYQYLTYMVTPAPMTLYKDVYKLPAGYYIRVDSSNTVTFKQWYEPLEYMQLSMQQKLVDEDYTQAYVENLLIKSIEKQMMSDVPYGVFLSGGVDSSLNVALMAQVTDTVRTFTVSFSDAPERDETEWARKVAKRYKTEHHEIVISEKEAFNFFQDMAYHHDEPLADCVSIPLYYVSKLLKDSGVTVVQVGEGADEIFCGYQNYIRYLNFNALYWHGSQKYIPAFAKQGLAKTAAKLFPSKFAHQEFLNNWAGDKPLFWGGAIAFPDTLKQKLWKTQASFDHDPIVEKIMPGFVQGYTSSAVPDYYLDRFRKLYPQGDFLQFMLYLELKQRLPELLLMRVDKMTMATGVEARVPFLDHMLVETGLQIPMNLKYRNGQTKYLLKKIAEKYLPYECIYRTKVGFGAPTARWFSQGTYFKPYFKDLLATKSSDWNEFFDFDYIDSMFTTHTRKEGLYDLQLWTLQNILASDRL